MSPLHSILEINTTCLVLVPPPKKKEKEKFLQQSVFAEIMTQFSKISP